MGKGFGLGVDLNANENKEVIVDETKPTEVVDVKPTDTVEEQQKPTETTPVETTKPTEQPKEVVDPKPTDELNDEAVLAYFNSKRDKENQLNSLEDLNKVEEKIVEKIVNPYADVLDDNDKAYLNFKKDTKLGRKEWEFVNQDVSKIPLLELAKRKVFEDTNLDLSDSDLKDYLEETQGVSFDEEELTTTDKIKLNSFVKPTRDKILEQQEKYKTPKKVEEPNGDPIEMVELDNGEKMPKSDYDKLVKDRNKYLKNIEEAVNNVTASDFKVEITENGEKRELNFSYEYSKEDKQNMLSAVSDIDATIEKRYKTKDGFDHKGLALDLFRGRKENLDKIISAVTQQVRAKTIEEMIANGNNENFNRKPMPQTTNTAKGYGTIADAITGKQGGSGLKVDLI